ncbi:hypothetical protein B7463_g4070, partial [Scytalidium lignicola]
MSVSVNNRTASNIRVARVTIPPRRLLSLDGGGVKGMAILLILKRLFRTIQRDENLPEIPRPCNYFDLIGGTSTGGAPTLLFIPLSRIKELTQSRLIAILLGRLRMSIDECIMVFRHVSEIVFKENPSTLSRAIGGVLGRPYFDASKLEEAIKDVLSTQGLREDAKFCEEKEDSNCKVFVCATRAQTVHPVLLRSYITWQATEENYDCFIWEVAKATSAAPLFFEPTKLRASRAVFVDGALHLNNPISEVINEAKSLWPGTDFKSIVSIGTGWIDPKGLELSQLKIHNVVKTCVDLAINSHKEAQKFARDNRGKELSQAGVYFRFDVDRGIDTVALDQWQKLDDVDAFTEAYLTRSGSELERCAYSLSAGKAVSDADHVADGEDLRGAGLLSTLPKYSDTSNSNFIFSGRETELSEIKTILDSSPPSRQTVCLHGLGGIGKSQIAFEYARRSSTSQSVFWIRANNLDNIESGYLAIAKELVPQFNAVHKMQIFETVRDQLAKKDTGPWLLVLDDADDLDLLVGNQRKTDFEQFKFINYIPFVAHGQVLVTTRQSRLIGMEDMVPAQNGIRVKEMTVEDGLALLKRCMPSELLSKASRAEGQKFLETLGGLPLAIVQATSYMREEQLPMEGFISLYQDIELHSELFKKTASSVDKQQKTILITWEISYQKIAGGLHTGSKSHPAILLDLLGFLDAQSLPSLRKLSEGQVFFRDSNGSTPIDGLEDLFEQQQSPAGLLKAVYDSNLKKRPNHELQLAIGPLCNFSLVTSRACWVHPVVHSWIYRRLSIEERHKYVSWLIEELLKKIAMADEGVQENWDDFMLDRTIRKLVVDELTPFRHALVVIRHAFSDAMRKFIRENKLPVEKFAQLLFQVGRMSASAGKIDKAIKYLQDAITAMKEDVHGGNPTLIAEWQLHLAKVRSGKLSPSEATAEARACTIGCEGSSLPAVLWLAECLRKEGRLQESLELFCNIMEAFSIHNAPNFRRDKEIFAAAVGKVYVLAKLGDIDSKAAARRIIDESLAPFLISMGNDHVLKVLLYPRILLCRIEVADGAGDQAKALRNLMEHEYRNIGVLLSLTGGNPESWLEQINYLRNEEKWSVIEVVGQEYIRRRLPLSTLTRKNFTLLRGDRTSSQLEAFSSEVDHWCNIYNHLGRAYFKHQRFRKAEETHWTAIGMGLSLCPNAIGSIGFRSNLWNLDQALERQGAIAEGKRRALDHHFTDTLTPQRLNQILATIAR